MQILKSIFYKNSHENPSHLYKSVTIDFVNKIYSKLSQSIKHRFNNLCFGKKWYFGVIIQTNTFKFIIALPFFTKSVGVVS